MNSWLTCEYIGKTRSNGSEGAETEITRASVHIRQCNGDGGGRWQEQ